MSITGNGNGHQKRTNGLTAAMGSARRERPPDITPERARQIIDEVFRSYGLDPTDCTDRSGWRWLQLGSAPGWVGVVEWQPEEHYLVISAPLFDLSDEDPPA